MNYAVIDLGSNSVRLSIYRCEKNKIKRTFSEKNVAGLAGYIAKGVMQAEGIQKACDVLNTLNDIASKFVEPSNLYVFATAVLRNIRNKDEAVQIIAERTSLLPDVLEGDEEAALGFAGVTGFMNYDSGIMIDIGGASTEFVHFKKGKVIDTVSLPLGCLNLSVEYIDKIIATEYERKQIKTAIRAQLARIDWGGDGDTSEKKYPLLVGTGGTLRAVLKLSQVLFGLPVQENSVNTWHVQEINKLLKYNKNNIYHTMHRTFPERLMTFPTGLTILHQAIKKFGSETISVSQYGIREGYLLERVLKQNGSYDIS
ncbi:MAG: phosphatase [Peptococcaceae bacterium]|nr:phosphatase [Peptococcaceae bacterium]